MAKQEVAERLVFLLSPAGQVRMARKKKGAFLLAFVVLDSGRFLSPRGQRSPARGWFLTARGRFSFALLLAFGLSRAGAEIGLWLRVMIKGIIVYSYWINTSSQQANYQEGKQVLH